MNNVCVELFGQKIIKKKKKKKENDDITFHFETFVVFPWFKGQI